MARISLASLPEHIKNEVIRLHHEGKTTHEIAASIGHAQSFVINVMKKLEIPRRFIYYYTRIYDVNEAFFDKIDTEAKAYFLGLMYADGNNYRSRDVQGGVNKSTNYEVSIALQSRDEHILKTFRDFICPNKELEFVKRYTDNHQDKYKPRFDSKRVSDQLIALGCIPAKSLKLRYPSKNQVPNELTHHFLRGYFDGDGSIHYYKKQWKTTTNNNYSMNMISAKWFCDEAAKEIAVHTGIDMYSMLSHEKMSDITTTISIGGNRQVRTLMNWLYKDATIYLYRKYDRFLDLQDEIAKYE